MEKSLYHYGVKGTKWGIRKKRKSTPRAKNYSSQQRIRDRKIYGRGSERRINKRMLNGESIQSARHNEVHRKARIDGAKKVTKTLANGALVVGGTVAVSAALKKYGNFSDGEKGVITETVINTGRHVINTLIR